MPFSLLKLVLAGLLLAGFTSCVSDDDRKEDAGADSGGTTDSDADADTDGDADTDAGGDADTDSDADGDSDSGAPPPDLTPPETVIETGPDALVNSTTALFTFSSPANDLSHFDCSLDHTAFAPCPVPPTFDGLGEDAHTLEVAAVDNAGNSDPTPAAWNWYIDSIGPDTFIDAGPPEFTKDAGAAFIVNCTEPPCTYECALDEAAFGACPQPTTPGVLEFTSVPTGRRLLEVRALDALGNADPYPARYNWIIYTDQWKAVDVGGSVACALSKSGGIWCWGYIFGAYYDQLTREPANASDWDKLSVGSQNICAINASKELYCWGYNYYGQLGQGDTEHRFTPTKVETNTDWAEVGVGNGTICGIRDNGSGSRTLWCWGYDDHRVLGQGWDAGAEGNRYVPTQVGEDTDWQTISVGSTSHVCAIKTDGTNWCWGYSGGGQCGHTLVSNYNAALPGQVWDVDYEDPDGGTTWSHVQAANQGTCGISSGTNFPGTLWCWGWAFRGEDGIENTELHSGLVPRQEKLGATDWVDVSRKSNVTCGIREDAGLRTMWCAGRNDYGQANGEQDDGVGLFEQRNADTDWDRISMGSEYGCATKLDGSLWCWGQNRNGVLGQGIPFKVSTPTREASRATDWLTVSAGSDHTCGIRDDGSDRSLWCWGYGTEGQSGNPAWQPLQVPTRIAGCAIDGGLIDGGCTDWVSVEAGGSQTCGIRQDGSNRTLWCMGDNSSGELGLGDAGVGRMLYMPEQETTGGTSWTQVEGNWSTTLGLQAGTRLAWGDDSSGRLGLGPTDGMVDTPTAAVEAGNWADICAGEEHGCGIRSNSGDRSLFCWGTNDNAELGIADAGVGEVNTPVQEVTEAVDWLDVACGESMTCAVKTGGTLHCWGTDENGSLGLGDAGVDTTVETPTQEVTGATDWVSVGVGYQYGCGMTAGNEVRCWGDNGNGNLGIGILDDTNAPTLIPGIDDWVELSVGGSHACGIRAEGRDRTLWCWGGNWSGQIGNGFAWSLQPLPVVNP